MQRWFAGSALVLLLAGMLAVAALQTVQLARLGKDAQSLSRRVEALAEERAALLEGEQALPRARRFSPEQAGNPGSLPQSLFKIFLQPPFRQFFAVRGVKIPPPSHRSSSVHTGSGAANKPLCIPRLVPAAG